MELTQSQALDISVIATTLARSKSTARGCVEGVPFTVYEDGSVLVGECACYDTPAHFARAHELLP